MYKNKYYYYNQKIINLIGGKIINEDCFMFNITKNLFLGTISCLSNPKILNDNNIKHIISVTFDENLYDIRSKSLQNIKSQHKYNIIDKFGNYSTTLQNVYNISEWNDPYGIIDSIYIVADLRMEVSIYEISDLIEIYSNRNENILIHCKYAKSRSPTVVIGYMMLKQNMTYIEVITFLSKKELLLSHIENGKYVWKDILLKIENYKNISDKKEYMKQLCKSLDEQETLLFEKLNK